MSDIVEVAIHESGHCAAAFVFSVKFTSVTCRPVYAAEGSRNIPYSIYDSLGHIQCCTSPVVFGCDRFIELYPDEKAYNYRYVRMLLGGAAAEVALKGSYDEWGVSWDFKRVREIIKLSGTKKRTSSEVEAEFTRLLDLTIKMFNDQGLVKPLWPKTYELAKAMYYNDRTLTYDEAKAIYDAN